MLSDERVIEKIVLGGNLAALQRQSHQPLELLRRPFVTAELHQRHQFGLVARLEPPDLLHNLFTAEVAFLVL